MRLTFGCLALRLVLRGELEGLAVKMTFDI